jgi:hypothetical protein
LPFVLYAAGTWSVALRDGHKLKVIENRVLREILGSKGKEVLRDWKRLDNEEIRDLCSTKRYLGEEMKEGEMGGACCTYVGAEKCIDDLGF